MHPSSYIVPSERAMRKVGGLLAEAVLNSRRRKTALVLALSGDLGTGKSTFARGFLRACGIRGRIASPSFLIFKRYPIKNYFENIYHFDLYRLETKAVKKELMRLGWSDILASPENIVLIEWAEKAKKMLPKNTITIQFHHGKQEHERMIAISKKP